MFDSSFKVLKTTYLLGQFKALEYMISTFCDTNISNEILISVYNHLFSHLHLVQKVSN